jgi:predicted nuclease of predicted toxin-antitoxin system
MIRFLADENFNGRILRGVLRVRPDVDVIRVQDTPVYQASDPDVLEWAAQEDRILLTHDIETLVGFANERIKAGQSMPGVIAVRNTLPIGEAIEDLLTIVGASEKSDWENTVQFLPL